MKFIGALLVACAAHHILVVSSSGADLLQESFQPERNPNPFKIDESSHNGTLNEASYSSQHQQDETQNNDTFPSKIIENRQTHTDTQSHDQTINNTPYLYEAPYTYNHPSQGHQVNKHFEQNPGVSQSLDPSYSQISSSPFNTTFLNITPYISPSYNNAPKNALVNNISSYNIPPSSITPYNKSPFGNNPFNKPFDKINPHYQQHFGTNPHNQPPIGNNQYNQTPFSHNQYKKSPLYNINPFNESAFENISSKNFAKLNVLSGQSQKRNCIRQLRTSEINCRKYSECSILDCDDPPPPPKGGYQYAAYGVDAKKYEFPHAAAIGWKLANRTDYSWACGGSLISERFVLTAGHCAKFRHSSFVREEPEIVRLGELDFTDEDGDIQDIAIQEFIVHPDYKPPSKYHDIALIRLAEPAIFGKSVRPTCLWSKETFPEYSTLTAIGWGALRDGGDNSEKLQKVYLEVVTQEVCNESYGKRFLKNGITLKQICARDDKMDTCRGDSGGALTIYNYGDGCEHHVHQVGITSFGPTCGQGIPGVYTRVRAYLGWIEGHVWPQGA